MNIAQKPLFSRDIYDLPQSFPSSAFSQDDNIIDNINPFLSTEALQHEELMFWLQSFENKFSGYFELRRTSELRPIVVELCGQSDLGATTFIEPLGKCLLILSAISLGATAENQYDQSLQLLNPVLYHLSYLTDTTPDINVLIACIIAIQVLEIMCAFRTKDDIVRKGVTLLKKMTESKENPFGNCRQEIEIIEARLMAFEMDSPDPVSKVPTNHELSLLHPTANQSLFRIYQFQYLIRSGYSSYTDPLQRYLDIVESSFNDRTDTLLRQEVAWTRIWLGVGEIDEIMSSGTFPAPVITRLCDFIKRQDIVDSTLINTCRAIRRKNTCLRVLWLVCSKYDNLSGWFVDYFTHVRETLWYQANIITLKKVYIDLSWMATLSLPNEVANLWREAPTSVREKK